MRATTIQSVATRRASTANSMKTVLLTGASGYLGQHILQSFLSHHDVHIYAISHKHSTQLQNSLDQRRSSIQATVSVHSLNLADEDEVENFLNDKTIDICIHTAALSSPRVCESDPEQARAVNVPKALVQAQARFRIIAMSTDQVYAGTEPPYKETDVAKPVNVYGQTKLEMEQTLIPETSVSLRSSIILGPKPVLAPTHDTFLHFCASRQDLKTVFYTDERRNVVFVNDVVAIVHWFVAHDDVTGIYNLGGPDSVSRYDMAKAVFEHFKWPTEAVILPQRKPPARPDEMLTPLDISMKVDKLERRTGLQLTPLSKMIRATFPFTS